VHGGCECERAVDDRLVGARTHDVGRRAFAEQQRESVHDHRFPGAGFGGQNVEAGLERKGDVGDDGEVTDAQLGQHSSSPPDPLSVPERGDVVRHHFRTRSLRSPQCSLRRKRLKKLSGPRRMRRMGCSARRTSSFSPGWIGVPTWPSNDTSTSSVQGGIGWMVTTAVAARTSGRTARVWGQMAVTTIASTVGTTMGPPADIEYAVDPVGVLTMIPSAEYCATSSPSTATLRRTTRATPPLWTTTSLRTSGSTRPAFEPLPVMLDRSARRGSIV